MPKLFKVAPYSHEKGGYLVFRGVPDDRVALFIDELEAEEYASHRNKMLEEKGSTAID